MEIPNSPAPAGTLQWLLDTHCMSDRRIEEWCDLFELGEADRTEMYRRYGERIVELTTFVYFWGCRDMPVAKKRTPGSTSGVTVRDHLFGDSESRNRVKKGHLHCDYFEDLEPPIHELVDELP